MKEWLIGLCVTAGVLFTAAAFYEIVAMGYAESVEKDPTYFNKGPQDKTETH